MAASQSSHDMVLANLRELTTFCTYLGTRYDPANPDLILTAVNTFTADCQSVLNDLRNAIPVLKDQMGDRAEYIDDTMLMLARIVAAHASSPNEALKTEAKGFVRQMRGRRAKALPKTPDGEPTEAQTSAVNVGYEDRTADFASLVATVTSDPDYKTKVADLTKIALADRVTTMQGKNSDVRNAQAPVDLARIARNDKFYLDAKNLVGLGFLMKQEIKSTFGANSPEYKQISGLKFRKPSNLR